MKANYFSKQTFLYGIFEEIELRPEKVFYFKLSNHYVKVNFDKRVETFILTFEDKSTVIPDYVSFSNYDGLEFIEMIEKTIKHFAISFNYEED